MKSLIYKIGGPFYMLLIVCAFFASCDFDYEIADTNSIVDETLPKAGFSYSQAADEAWRTVSFTNTSASSTDFSWDLGNAGDTSTDENPSYTYPGAGVYTVTLMVSDKNGINDAITREVTVIEPEEPDVPDPIVINAEFDKLPKSSGSDCSCAAWINKNIGEQGESSSGNGGSDNVVKFDNNEPDHVYQEFAVQPNANYSIELVTSFKPSENGPFPAMLEVRVLAGTGYNSGYTPTYYTETVDFPQEDWGYSTVAQVEDSANNLFVEVQENPGNDDYTSYTYVFNSGDNNSVALFIRGIGGDAIGDYGYTGGDEEIRADYVLITAIN